MKMHSLKLFNVSCPHGELRKCLDGKSSFAILCLSLVWWMQLKKFWYKTLIQGRTLHLIEVYFTTTGNGSAIYLSWNVLCNLLLHIQMWALFLPLFPHSYCMRCLSSLVSLVNSHLIVELSLVWIIQPNVVSSSISTLASLLNILSSFNSWYDFLGSHVVCSCLVLSIGTACRFCHCNIPKEGKEFLVLLKNYCSCMVKQETLTQETRCLDNQSMSRC